MKCSTTPYIFSCLLIIFNTIQVQQGPCKDWQVDRKEATVSLPRQEAAAQASSCHCNHPCLCSTIHQGGAHFHSPLPPGTLARAHTVWRTTATGACWSPRKHADRYKQAFRNMTSISVQSSIWPPKSYDSNCAFGICAFGNVFCNMTNFLCKKFCSGFYSITTCYACLE